MAARGLGMWVPWPHCVWRWGSGDTPGLSGVGDLGLVLNREVSGYETEPHIPPPAGAHPQALHWALEHSTTTSGRLSFPPWLPTSN